MKQEIFKSMYNQISLNEGRKNEIWRKLQEKSEGGSMAKRARLTARAAAFAGIFLLSGMTVFAAGKLSLADWFAKTAMYEKNEQILTQEQRDIYEQYGQVLDNEIKADDGTFKLEAVIYDERFVIIPFSYISDSNDKDYKNITAEIFKSNIGLRFKPDSEHAANSFNTLRKWNEGDDGVIRGRYVLDVDAEKALFKQGDVIQAFTVKEDDATEPAVLSEFTIGAMAESRSLAIDEAARKTLEDKGVFIEEISVSPISLMCSVVSKDKERYPVSAVSKDGSIIKYGSYNMGDAKENDGSLKEAYPYRSSVSILFQAPVQPGEIEGIIIRVGITDIQVHLKEQ